MSITFGSLIEQFSLNHFAISTPAGNLTQTINGYLWFQGVNRAGRNLLSDPYQISAIAGQKIRIVLNTDDDLGTTEPCPATPSTIDPSLMNLYFLIVSFSETNDPTTARQVTLYSFREADQITFKSFPVTIDLTNDDDFNFDPVATPASLPLAPINGQIKYINSTCKYYQFDETATTGDYAGDSGGYWKETTFNGYTYIESTRNAGGCDRPVGLLRSYYAPPAKPDNVDSIDMIYWLVNGYDEDGQAELPVGYNLGVKVTCNGASQTADGIPFANIFNGFVIVKLIGYVRVGTGILNTDIEGAGVEFPWNAAVPFTLPIPLPRGYAAAYAMRLSFGTEDLQDAIPVNSSIGISLIGYGTVSKASILSSVIGDCVLNLGGRLRVYPGIRDGGQAIGKGFETAVLGSAEYVGLGVDTDNQIAAMNIAYQGAITIRPNTNAMINTEVKRAIIGTLPGEGGVSVVSNTISIGANSSIVVTVNHPRTSSKWDIRSDYDDVIAGKTGISEVYPLFMRLYVVKDNTTTYLYQSQTNVVNSDSQQITISSLSTIGTVPTDITTFGLFRPETPSIAEEVSTGTLASGSYKVYVVYYYPTGNTIPTRISHKVSDGCIPEINANLVDLLNTENTQVQEQIAVLGTNSLDDLTYTPNGDVTLIINGLSESTALTPAPFTISTTSILWDDTVAGYDLDTNDKVVAVYKY